MTFWINWINIPRQGLSDVLEKNKQGKKEMYLQKRENTEKVSWILEKDKGKDNDDHVYMISKEEQIIDFNIVFNTDIEKVKKHFL